MPRKAQGAWTLERSTGQARSRRGEIGRPPRGMSTEHQQPLFGFGMCRPGQWRSSNAYFSALAFKRARSVHSQAAIPSDAGLWEAPAEAPGKKGAFPVVILDPSLVQPEATLKSVGSGDTPLIPVSPTGKRRGLCQGQAQRTQRAKGSPFRSGQSGLCVALKAICFLQRN